MSCIEKNLRLLSEEYSIKNIYKIISSNGEKIAAQYSEGDKIRRITYNQYDKYIKRSAFLLKGLLGNEYIGQYAALKLDNCPEWPILFWAIFMSGCKVLLIDFRAPYNMTCQLMKEAGCKVIITDDNSFPQGDIKVIETSSIIDKNNEAPSDWKAQWSDKMALCTSGTTGASRIYVYDGVAISNHLKNAENIVKQYPVLMPEDNNVRIMAFIPLHHVFGVFAVYFWYAFFGKTIVFLKNRGANTIMQTSRMHRVTHIYAVPLLWNGIASGVGKKLKGLPKRKQSQYERIFKLSILLQRMFPDKARIILYNTVFKKIHEGLLGNDIRLLISGGGRISPDTLRIINALGLPLVSGYGMTEVGITSVDMTGKIKNRLNANLGAPFTSYKYKLNGEDERKTGELCIKGTSMHVAALKDGIELHPDVDSDGWLHCGDVAVLKNNMLYLKGRIKDVIINAEGENIYPDELEEYYNNIIGMEQMCILGKNKEDGYEAVTIIIYPNESVRANKNYREIMCNIYSINQRLPIYKRVKEAYISKEQLPTANMKIKRGAVKRRLQEEMEGFIQLNITDVVDNSEETALDSQSDVLHFEKRESNTGEDERAMDIKEALRNEFSQILDIPPEEIKDTSSFTEDLGGDSLVSIELLSKVEESYGIHIPDSQYYRCGNIRDLSQLILELLLKGDNNKN